MRVSDEFLIRISVAYNNEPQMGDVDSIRKPYAVRAILLRDYFACTPQFVFTLLSLPQSSF